MTEAQKRARNKWLSEKTEELKFRVPKGNKARIQEHAKKLVERELVRLRKSFELAKADGYRKFIMFLHYPPTNILEERSGFTDMAEEYGAEQVIYAHSHGESRFHDSIEGEYRGRVYHLVSGDYLRWKPLKVLE